MASALENLPTELIEVVSDFCILLDTEDQKPLLQLRSASCTLEAATRRKWRNHYFDSRAICIEENELKRLQEIASYPEFAHAVKLVDVECVDNQDLMMYGKPGSYVTAEAYDVEMFLVRAFQNLKDLETIRFLPVESPKNVADGDYVLDFSETFGLVLSAVEACRLRPQSIFAADIKGRDFIFVVTRYDVSALPTNIFRNLATLSISLARHAAVPTCTRSELDFTKWFVAALNQMQSLEDVYLSLFEEEEGQRTEIFKAASQAVKLPMLEAMVLRFANCEARGLIVFLKNHSETLRYCAFHLVYAESSDGSAYGDLLSALASDVFDLEDLSLGPFIAYDGTKFDFPLLDSTSVNDEPNEDGYLVVEESPFYRFKGKDKIQDGLSKMMGCIVQAQ